MNMIADRRAVTIDGPSGVGKTAVARELAAALGWRWISAGMLYRALAAGEADGTDLRIEFTTAADGIADPMVRLGNRTLTENDLRGADLARRASRMATDPAVRARVHEALADAAPTGMVLEGRAMHRIAPHAAQHLFLWADPAERAGRMRAIGERYDAARDARDRGRDHDPLRPHAGMTVWNSTRYSLADTVAGLARRVRIALGETKPVVTMLSDERPPGLMEPEAVELRWASDHDVHAVADLLRDSDAALVLPRDALVGTGWLDAHLRVLLSGNDIVTVGGSVFGLTSVTRGIDGSHHREALAGTGNIGFTCDMVRESEPAGTVREWWMSAARSARWVSVPTARAAAHVAEVVHLYREEDCESVLDRLATGGGGPVVVVDHVGLPTLPLLAEAARADVGSVHVVGPEWRAAP